MSAIWNGFLDSFDRQGGHLLLLLMLCVGGAIASQYHIAHAEDITHDSFIALLSIISTQKRNFTNTGDGPVLQISDQEKK